MSGAERLAYRIQGEACLGTQVPGFIQNDYSSNEAHSAMSGVSLWPLDRGFYYDRSIYFKHHFNMKELYFFFSRVRSHQRIHVSIIKCLRYSQNMILL